MEKKRTSNFLSIDNVAGEISELLSAYRNKQLKQPIIYAVVPNSFQTKRFHKNDQQEERQSNTVTFGKN